jgi:hypothetical protein
MSILDQVRIPPLVIPAPLGPFGGPRASIGRLNHARLGNA